MYASQQARAQKAILATTIFIAAFALYAVTGAPEVTFHDSGQLITAAWTLGIPHPPGAPLWVLLSHLFTWIPIGSPAYRVHLFSGFCGALTSAFLYLFVSAVARKVLRSGSSEMGASAGVMAACPRTITSVLGQSVQAELYTLNSFFVIAILYTLIHWEPSAAFGRRAVTFC